MPKTLVIYTTTNINENLLFFLNHGYIENSDNVDFYICFNNDDALDILQWQQNITNNNLHNLYLLKRPNLGYDFGAWIDVIYSVKNEKQLWESYDYFIILNSTCMGPFLPVYENRSWVDIFTGMINDKVKLVGPTINVYQNKPHVQSYCLCFDKELFMKLKDLNFIIPDHLFKDKKVYDNCYVKEDFVEHFEVGMSLNTMKLGYNIKCLLKGYETINYNYIFHNFNEEKETNLPYGRVSYDVNGCVGWDPCANNRYFGITMHPYEVMFYKSNRCAHNNVFEMYKQFHIYHTKKNYSHLIFNQ